MPESLLSTAEFGAGFSKDFLLKVFYSFSVIGAYLPATRLLSIVSRRRIEDTVREYIAARTAAYIRVFRRSACNYTQGLTRLGGDAGRLLPPLLKFPLRRGPLIRPG
ncbi:MAG: hypothetical protein CVU79_03645 [Elusimicrobia bacterium HGW-Elusimicrobia-3]|nr:MAG: hypothetical protein CVU79_03645 [Elusimicrobia bacterium HGW-Elusimicrobia-3]